MSSIPRTARDPFPDDLPRTLPNPQAPWVMSKDLFNLVRFRVGQEDSYHKAIVTQAHPEWKFVHTHFSHDPPENRHIAMIYCLHNPSLTNPSC